MITLIQGSPIHREIPDLVLLFWSEAVLIRSAEHQRAPNLINKLFQKTLDSMPE